MELTQQHLDAITNTAAAVAGLVEDMKDLKADVCEVKASLAAHSSALDAIGKDVKDWNTEIMAVRARLDRHDQWFKTIADNLHLRLD